MDFKKSKKIILSINKTSKGSERNYRRKKIIEERKRAKLAVTDEKTKKKSLLDKKMDKALAEMQEQAKINNKKMR